ncbi:DUF4157 domain-containing protein [Leptolyngbyaceae cyanobacterium UHCC 1019]
MAITSSKQLKPARKSNTLKSSATTHASSSQNEAGATSGMPLFLQRSSVSQTGAFLQPKLAVNEPGDIYEQEADRVAEQVMKMPSPASAMPQEPLSTEEEAVQMKPTTISPVSSASLQQKCSKSQREGQVQRSGNGTAEVGSDIESQLNSSKGGGSPLSDEVRSFMEPRFGADFSQVRVHTGSEAAQMNRDLNAQAFTHQQDVYFGAGKASGKDALTAHELTHTVQQAGEQLVQLQSKPDQFNKLIQNGDWHGAAWTLAQRDPQEITAKVRSMSSMQLIYLVEGARHGEGNWSIDSIISTVDKISHREFVIGSVRFFVWKHRWREAGTYLCGLSDEDMRQVAINLKLTLSDINAMADEQQTDNPPAAGRIFSMLLLNTEVRRQAPRDSIGKDGGKKVELWLLNDPLVGQYAKSKFDAGIAVRGHLHIIPEAKWADTRVKHTLGRRHPDTGKTEKDKDELRKEAITVRGFTVDKKEIYIRQGEDSPSTVLHEVIHLISEQTFIEDYGIAVNEGTTEYFARLVARRAGFHPGRNYNEEHNGVAALAYIVGDVALAEAFFTGKVLSMQQAVEDIKGPKIFREWCEVMRDDSQRKNAPKILNGAPKTSK